ncbi:unnamed protein product, partial [marine sediment metagenome]
RPDLSADFSPICGEGTEYDIWSDFSVDWKRSVTEYSHERLRSVREDLQRRRAEVWPASSKAEFRYSLSCIRCVYRYDVETSSGVEEAVVHGIAEIWPHDMQPKGAVSQRDLARDAAKYDALIQILDLLDEESLDVGGDAT